MKNALFLPLLLLLTVPGRPHPNEAPQPPDIWTARALNCRGWRTLNSTNKASYVMGLIEGFVLAAEEDQAKIDDYKGHAKLIYEERVQGINQFCAAPENSRVPTMWALRVFSWKSDGISRDIIEAAEADLREKTVQLIQADTGKGK